MGVDDAEQLRDLEGVGMESADKSGQVKKKIVNQIILSLGRIPGIPKILLDPDSWKEIDGKFVAKTESVLPNKLESMRAQANTISGVRGFTANVLGAGKLFKLEATYSPQ